MRGREFIRVAKMIEFIAKTEKGKRKEALLRIAISRIYYGTLWEVMDFLEEHGTRINREYRIHETVRASLKAKGYEKVSRRMKTLHDLRKIADYDHRKTVERKDFINALSLSKFILKEVGR